MSRGCLSKILLLLPIALLLAGSQRFFVAISNRKPTEIRMMDAETHLPAKAWLNLKEAYANFGEATLLTSSLEEDQLVIPLHGQPSMFPGQLSNVAAVLIVKDPEVLKTFAQYQKLDEAERTIWHVTHAKTLFPAASVKGLVLFGLDRNRAYRRAIEKQYGPQLTSDWLLIEQNEAPSLGVGLALVLSAVVCWVLLLVLVLVQRKKAVTASVGAES